MDIINWWIIKKKKSVGPTWAPVMNRTIHTLPSWISTHQIWNSYKFYLALDRSSKPSKLWFSWSNGFVYYYYFFFTQCDYKNNLSIPREPPRPWLACLEGGPHAGHSLHQKGLPCSRCWNTYIIFLGLSWLQLTASKHLCSSGFMPWTP